MAKQVGPFKFLGKLGNLFGYIEDGEYCVKTIGKVEDAVRKHAPQYEVTRQNEREFGVASSCGQLFRHAMTHITQRWTTKHYTPKVMQLMVATLRADQVHVKGQKSINYGLKNVEAQMSFRRLEMYTKKNYTHYRGCLMHETNDPLVWKMNHQVLWTRRDDGDTKSVKLGFLHIDFDRKIAKYEDGISITCRRNDQIEHSEVQLAPSGDIKLPWTFVIQQVWRDGDIYEPTGMLFMSVLQVIEGEMAEEHGLHGAEGQRLHGAEMAEGHGLQRAEEHGLLCKDDLNKEEIDLQVALRLVGNEIGDLYVAEVAEEHGLRVAETHGLQMAEEHGVQRAEGHGMQRLQCKDVAEEHGLHSAEGYGLHGLQRLDRVEVAKELSELGSFGYKVEDEQRGDVRHTLDKDVKYKRRLERFASSKLYETSERGSQRQNKKRFQRDSVKEQKIQRLIGRRLVLQET